MKSNWVFPVEPDKCCSDFTLMRFLFCLWKKMERERMEKQRRKAEKEKAEKEKEKEAAEKVHV